MPSGTRKIRAALDKASQGDNCPILRQIVQMLKSGICVERIGARKILLDIVLKSGSEQAQKMLLEDCRTALASGDAEERELVRDALGHLSSKKGCKEAEALLRDYKAGR